MPKTQEIEHFVLNWNFPLFNSLLGWEIPKFNWRLFCIYAKDLLAKILQLYIWKSSKSLIAAVVFLLFTTFLNKNLHLPNEVKIIPQNKIVDDQTSAKKKIVEVNITQAQVQVNQTLKTWEFVWLRMATSFFFMQSLLPISTGHDNLRIFHSFSCNCFIYLLICIIFLAIQSEIGTAMHTFHPCWGKKYLKRPHKNRNHYDCGDALFWVYLFCWKSKSQPNLFGYIKKLVRFSVDFYFCYIIWLAIKTFVI